MPFHMQTALPMAICSHRVLLWLIQKTKIMHSQRVGYGAQEIAANKHGPKQWAPQSELMLLLSIEEGKPSNGRTWRLAMAKLVSSHCRPMSVHGVQTLLGLLFLATQAGGLRDWGPRVQQKQHTYSPKGKYTMKDVTRGDDPFSCCRLTPVSAAETPEAGSAASEHQGEQTPLQQMERSQGRSKSSKLCTHVCTQGPPQIASDRHAFGAGCTSAEAPAAQHQGLQSVGRWDLDCCDGRPPAVPGRSRYTGCRVPDQPACHRAVLA